MAHPCHRRAHALGITLEDGLDAPVREVAHPAVKPEFTCPLGGRAPEEDALYDARHPDVRSHRLAHGDSCSLRRLVSNVIIQDTPTKRTEGTGVSDIEDKGRPDAPHAGLDPLSFIDSLAEMMPVPMLVTRPTDASSWPTALPSTCSSPRPTVSTGAS